MNNAISKQVLAIVISLHATPKVRVDVITEGPPSQTETWWGPPQGSLGEGGYKGAESRDQLETKRKQ